MRLFRAVLTTLLGLGLCSLAGAGPQEPPAPAQPSTPPTFRSGIEVVALNVTVLDREQHLVGDLVRENFQVFEDGVQQQIRYFEAGEVPLDLAILLDASVSMAGKLPFVRAAAIDLARMLRAGDRAAVLSFNDMVRVPAPFTDDLQAIEHAINTIEARGGTALYNAIYVALRQFGRTPPSDDTVRRRAIVVLSDGEDTASLLSFEELLAEAQRAGVTIYTIGLRTPDLMFARGSKRGFSQADWTMRALAQATGATVHFPLEPGDVQQAYASIGRELAQQYAIGYVSSNPMRNGAFRRVTVRVVDRPEVRSRTRPGYVAGTPGSLALKE